MPRIVIKSAVVDEEENQKLGRIMRSQYCDLDLGNGHALPFRIGLGQRPAMKPGEYDIDPKSFGLDQYGNLVLKKYVDLVPAGSPGAAKAG